MSASAGVRLRPMQCLGGTCSAWQVTALVIPRGHSWLAFARGRLCLHFIALGRPLPRHSSFPQPMPPVASSCLLNLHMTINTDEALSVFYVACRLVLLNLRLNLIPAVSFPPSMLPLQPVLVLRRRDQARGKPPVRLLARDDHGACPNRNRLATTGHSCCSFCAPECLLRQSCCRGRVWCCRPLPFTISAAVSPCLCCLPATYAACRLVLLNLRLQVRAYNGYCYEWGTTNSRGSEAFKVRPQDEVRFDLDFDEGDGVLYMR